MGWWGGGGKGSEGRGEEWGNRRGRVREGGLNGSFLPPLGWGGKQEKEMQDAKMLDVTGCIERAFCSSSNQIFSRNWLGLMRSRFNILRITKYGTLCNITLFLTLNWQSIPHSILYLFISVQISN